MKYVLVAAYVTGLAMLTATKHHEAIRIGLIHLGLLTVDGSAVEIERCLPLIPFGRGTKLHAGQGLRSCRGLCEDCDAHYLAMHENGRLALYHGSDATAKVIWQANLRPWWRKHAVPPWVLRREPTTSRSFGMGRYWATIGESDLHIGLGDDVVWRRNLSKCKRLVDRIVPLSNATALHSIAPPLRAADPPLMLNTPPEASQLVRSPS